MLVVIFKLFKKVKAVKFSWKVLSKNQLVHDHLVKKELNHPGLKNGTT